MLVTAVITHRSSPSQFTPLSTCPTANQIQHGQSQAHSSSPQAPWTCSSLSVPRLMTSTTLFTSCGIWRHPWLLCLPYMRHPRKFIHIQLLSQIPLQPTAFASVKSLTISSSGYYNRKLIGISPCSHLICYIHSDPIFIQTLDPTLFLCKPSRFPVFSFSNGNKYNTYLIHNCYGMHMRYFPAPCMAQMKHSENVSYCFIITTTIFSAFIDI